MGSLAKSKVVIYIMMKVSLSVCLCVLCADVYVRPFSALSTVCPFTNTPKN